MEKETSVKSNLIVSIIEELKKVSWPSKNATISLTVIVFIISLIVGAYLGIIDILLAKALELVTKS